MDYKKMMELQQEALKRYEDHPSGHWADQNQFLLTATLLQISMSLETIIQALPGAGRGY